MIKKKIYVKADIFNIQLVTNCDKVISFIHNNLFEFKRLTINFQILNKNIDTDVDMVFIYRDNPEFNINFFEDKQEFIVNCPWEKINQSTVFPMFFRYIVELLRQKKGQIKLHSSAIEKNGKVSLFLAPSEGGKTTTALAMCQNYECSLKANDAAVIEIKDSMPVMLRGDTEFKVRYNGLEAYSKKIFNDKVNKETLTNMPWFNKMRITPDEIGVVTNDTILPVHYIFFVKIDSLMSECSLKKYSDDFFERKEYWFKPKMQILQNIGGTIKGNDLIPLGNDGVILPINIPSLDTLDLSLKRINFINKLFDSCEIYQVRGQLTDITKTIYNIIEKSY